VHLARTSSCSEPPLSQPPPGRLGDANDKTPTDVDGKELMDEVVVNLDDAVSARAAERVLSCENDMSVEWVGELVPAVLQSSFDLWE